jgi:eukaryotic-like serine/threonine-protein kinase
VAEPGTRLAAALADRYRIERELGAGGMATVYLARDLKHDRDVAIKVLHPDLGAALGAERFLSEIRTTARLQHPHILPLLDSGEADGLLYYAMPLVTGETLRARLEREQQLPVDDAVRIAREVADALGYAHGLGVIHRDIKPENILLQSGHALVADFGIALAVQTAAGQRMTQTGLSLGTPQYMSPEQAMGERTIDARSDIYALGAVTYEMLVGEPPFTGPSVQAIVARLVTEEPRRISVQRKAVPAEVEAAVLRALEKLPADRFATANEFARSLTDGSAPARRTVVMKGAPAAVGRGPILAAIALGSVGLVAGLVLGRTTRASAVAPPPPVVRYAVELPDSTAITSEVNTGIAVAPDGSRFAYASRAGLMIQSADQLAAQRVPGGVRGSLPFFSPDGRWLGFQDGARLVKLSLAGGAPVVVCDSCVGYSFSWDVDDTIRYHTAPAADRSSRMLMAISSRGGTPRELARPASGNGEAYRSPMLVPGTRTVLFALFTGNTSNLASLDLQTGKVHRLDQSGFSPRWVSAGYVAFGTADGGLLALPWDKQRSEPTGPPITIARDVSQPDGFTSRAGVSISGTIMYLRSGGALRRNLLEVPRAGPVTRLPGEARVFGDPRISPDGGRLAVSIVDPATFTKDVWILDLRQQTWTRVTTDGLSDHPMWTQDGRRIIYSTNDDLWWVASDGSGRPDSLLVANGSRYGGSVTRDGKSLIFMEIGSERAGIRRLDFDRPQAAEQLLPGTFNEALPALSPDGHWLAYQSEETGSAEVYVRPYPGLGARMAISLQGGSEPVWSPDGRELFYRVGDSLMAAAVAPGSELAITGRRAVVTGDFMHGDHSREYDVTPDGRQFIMLSGGSGRSVLIGMLNVFANLRRDGAAAR